MRKAYLTAASFNRKVIRLRVEVFLVRSLRSCEDIVVVVVVVCCYYKEGNCVISLSVSDLRGSYSGIKVTKVTRGG